MNVFDITKLIEFLLIFYNDKLSFFLVDFDIQWKQMFLMYIFPRHIPVFLETLERIIQENLFHTYNGHSPCYKEVTGVPAGHNHFSRFSQPDDCTKLGNEEDYQEFDTLTYTISLVNTYEIFEAGQLTLSFVSAKSLVSEECSEEFGQRRHPLADVKLMNYRPGSRDRMKEGPFSDHHDGNVIFALKRLDDHGGIVDRKGEKVFHYYFVKLVENSDACICRILVTRRVYSQLCLYDPYKKGGPWYVENGKHYHLVKIQNSKGEQVSNKVEFYREEHNNKTALTSWLINHEILYDRNKNVGDLNGMLRIALGLLACKMAQPDNPILQHWFLIGSIDIYEELRNIHTNIQAELSDCRKEINRSFPDHFTKIIAHVTSKCNFGQNGEEIFHLYDEMSKHIAFGNIDMIGFVQSILKFYRSHLFLKEMELHTIYKKFISLVNPDCSSLFVEELERALQEHVLHRIHRKVIVRTGIRTRQNWTDFSYYIKHPISSKSKGSVYVRHWLPKDCTDLLPDDDAASDMTYYKEFDVLIKSPDERSYLKIGKIREKQFEPVLHKINGLSVANTRNRLYDDRCEREGTHYHYKHPLIHADVYCYMADLLENVENESKRKEKYGEDTFRMRSVWGNEGIYREKNQFNHYLIEVIDLPDESICRILATYYNTYPELLKIDSMTKGGPFYLEVKDKCMYDKYFYLGMIRNHEGRKVRNKIEVLREVGNRQDGYEYVNWLRNHESFR